MVVDDAPGWQAIDRALARRYGDRQPRHVGYTPPAAFSTNLDGCSAHRADSHWHYVSYGLSELYTKDPEADPAWSGWGFELTLRVPVAGDDAPGWPFSMVNEMAKMVNGTGAPVAAGHRIDLRAAVTGYPHLPDAPPTGLTVFAVTPDPELGTIETPHGRLEFLQLVGVTAAEKDRMVGADDTEVVLAELRARDPLLVTDPARARPR